MGRRYKANTKLAIKSDKNRSSDIIAILESLGGMSFNFENYHHTEDYYYFISNNGIIVCDYIDEYSSNQYTLLTIDEYYDLFPYKLGDEFNYSEVIDNMFWDENYGCVLYKTNKSQGYVTATELMLDSYGKCK